eukprot:TRINITY_DN109180_c0_g1_i1.p1 TRINITY_DN109180_c0_g1~~TRINITY_DN109180_c0_g1_i1.p1  ORF type:complete len:691 (+),score=235.75 TRINITY_DN109180_c0_g1_i1:79-2151(+)
MKFQLQALPLFVSTTLIEANKLISVSDSVTDEATEKESPVNKVVLFMKELKTEVEADKAAEKASYEKYSKWCEDTAASTNKEIEEAKQVIDDETAKIERFSGKGSASSAQIEYVKKCIVDNGHHQAEADTIRGKEKKKFEVVKADLESGIQAFKDMSESLGAGSESSFLTTNAGQRQAKLRNIASRALKIRALASKLSLEDRKLLDGLANDETQLVQLRGSEEPASALGGVINVIRTTQEDYERDLKSAVDEEAEHVQNHKNLKKTLAEELSNLQETLTVQQSSQGDSSLGLVQAKMLREETEESLKSSEKLLVETQDACRTKADIFATRSKLREEELDGIVKALKILESDEAKKTFAGSAGALLQVHGSAGSKAFDKLKELASTFHSMGFAQLALQVQNGGHFDKVINSINKQIEHLRDEEKMDVEHRDRCEKQLAESAAKVKSLKHSSQTVATKIERMTGDKQEFEADFEKLQKDIADTKKEIKDREEIREKERQDHLTALQHDKDAVELVKEATITITKFSKNNKASNGFLGLVQRTARRVFHSAPDAGFEDSKYEGADAMNGVVTLLNMVRADMTSEIDAAKKDDDAAQGQYESDYRALKAKLESQEKANVSVQRDLAVLQQKITLQGDFQSSADDDAAAEKASLTALKSDCAWVKSNFDSRRTKRKAEIDGLTEAKGLLAAGGAR